MNFKDQLKQLDDRVAKLKDQIRTEEANKNFFMADPVPYDSQLFRYFHCTSTKLSILTNGISYRLHTNLIEPNKMDEKFFFEFRIDDPKDTQTEKLKEFHKSHFDLEQIITSASELKYTNEIRNIIKQQSRLLSGTTV